MLNYILPIVFLVISGFVFLQNKRPIEERPLAFDDPWGPIIYIPTGVIGLYMLFMIGIWSLILGWFFSMLLAQILSSIIYKKEEDVHEQRKI